MRIIAVAMTTSEATKEDDVADFIRYDAQLLNHSRLQRLDACRRWRGINLRAESVRAWRCLWQFICGEVQRQGIVSVDELREWFKPHRRSARPVARGRQRAI